MVVREPTGQKYHFCTQGTFWYGDLENSKEPKIWPTWRLYDVIFQNSVSSLPKSAHLITADNFSQIRGLTTTKS